MRYSELTILELYFLSSLELFSFVYQIKRLIFLFFVKIVPTAVRLKTLFSFSNEPNLS
jgi:hypothetical protein